MAEKTLPPRRTNEGQPNVEEAWDAAYASKPFRDALVDDRSVLGKPEKHYLQTKSEAVEEASLQKNPDLAKLRNNDAYALEKVRQDLVGMGIPLEGEIAERARENLGLNEDTLKAVHKENKLRTSWWKRKLRDFNYQVKANAIPYDQELMARLVEEVGGSMLTKMAGAVNNAELGLDDAFNRNLLNALRNANDIINNTLGKCIKTRSGVFQRQAEVGSYEFKVSRSQYNLLANPKEMLGFLANKIERVAQGDFLEIFPILKLLQLEPVNVTQEESGRNVTINFDEHTLEILNSLVRSLEADERPYIKQSISQLIFVMEERGYMWNDLDGFKKVAQLGPRSENKLS